MRSEPVDDDEEEKAGKRFLTADRFNADHTDWKQRLARRVAEFGHLADQLRSCKLCSQPLQLHKSRQDRRYEYTSMLRHC